MLISYKHKFIFMHCRKAAGSTISALCNPYLGPDDVQVGIWGDIISNGGSYNARASNILREHKLCVLKGIFRDVIHGKLPHRPRTYQNDEINSFYENNYAFGPVPAHASAVQVQSFDPAAWRNFFKFCIVRNPWTHAVSDFYWRKRLLFGKRGCDVKFKEFLRRLNDPSRPDPEGLRPPIRSNWSVYTINDVVQMDIVARFENLANDLVDVQRKIGLSLDLRKFRAKGGIRDRRKMVAEHYDAESIDLVRQIYSEEIDQFNYHPDIIRENL